MIKTTVLLWTTITHKENRVIQLTNSIQFNLDRYLDALRSKIDQGHRRCLRSLNALTSLFFFKIGIWLYIGKQICNLKSILCIISDKSVIQKFWRKILILKAKGYQKWGLMYGAFCYLYNCNLQYKEIGLTLKLEKSIKHCIAYEQTGSSMNVPPIFTLDNQPRGKRHHKMKNSHQ